MTVDISNVNRTTDLAVLASSEVRTPVAPDESVPWFQGIMVMKRPTIPSLHKDHDRPLPSVAWCYRRQALNLTVAAWEPGGIKLLKH